MEYPETVYSAVDRAVRRWGDDIDKAVNWLNLSLRRRKDFDDLLDGLLQDACRDLIHDRRHTINVKIRNQNGHYDKRPKVQTGGGAGQRAAESYYDYYIGGSTLGLLQGDELEEIADHEEAIAEGHTFNARLCRKLRKIVSDGKLVKDAVSESRLRKIFRECKKS
ncbi:MAG: hypothetical protein ACYSTI_14195 [Planctomycetota bacterium]|jgi:hypothetical protein